HRRHATQAELPCKGLILRGFCIVRFHAPSQALRLLTAVRDHRFFHTLVDRLLRPIGGPHKPIEAGQLYKETDQPDPTRPDFHKHHMEGQHQAMEEGKTGSTLKELDHMTTDI